MGPFLLPTTTTSSLNFEQKGFLKYSYVNPFYSFQTHEEKQKTFVLGTFELNSMGLSQFHKKGMTLSQFIQGWFLHIMKRNAGEKRCWEVLKRFRMLKRWMKERRLVPEELYKCFYKCFNCMLKPIFVLKNNLFFIISEVWKKKSFGFIRSINWEG